MFEYVASGLAHTRLNKNSINTLPKDDKTIVAINNMIKSLKVYNHNIAFLFNAYTERKLGVSFQNLFYPNTLDNIYADSGGLQMVTLGHQSNSEMKMDVYKTQAELSTVAMSFDEIPVEFSGLRSTRHDVQSKLFNGKLLKEKAIISSKNLKEQIEYFKSNNETKCKPMLIVQGNCYNSYNDWANISLEEIGKENWKYIKGLAIAGTSLGIGPMEDFKKAFCAFNLELPEDYVCNHYHLLGVGSISRLIPILAIKDRVKDTIISYDSTTHTSGISRGQYFYDNNMIKFPQTKIKPFYYTLDSINENLSSIGLHSIEEEHLYARLSNPSLWDKKYKEDVYSEFYTIFGYLFSSIYNFMHTINQLETNQSFFDNYIDKKGIYLPTKTFKECITYQDFLVWEKTHTGILSKAVSNMDHVPLTLDNYFM